MLSTYPRLACETKWLPGQAAHERTGRGGLRRISLARNWTFAGSYCLSSEKPSEYLEPISKSSEEDNEAGELDKAEEVLGVILPADEDAALPLDPSEEALDEPASHVAA